jgi:hypothetical protein
MRGRLNPAALGVAAVVAGLATASCGSSHRASTVVPVFSVPVPKPPPAPLVPVVARPSSGLQQVRWLAILAITGQKYVLSYDLKGCQGPAIQATVGHTASTVSIALWDKGPAPDQVCADIVRPAKVAVIVATPIAGHTVSNG